MPSLRPQRAHSNVALLYRYGITHTNKTIVINIAAKPITIGIREDSVIDIPFAQSKDRVPAALSVFYT